MGDTSVEFMALADAGEASLVYRDCGYAAGLLRQLQQRWRKKSVSRADRVIHTPGIVVDDVSVSPAATRRLLRGTAETVSQLCFVPGTHELNEVKAERLW